MTAKSDGSYLKRVPHGQLRFPFEAHSKGLAFTYSGGRQTIWRLNGEYTESAIVACNRDNRVVTATMDCKRCKCPRLNASSEQSPTITQPWSPGCPRISAKRASQRRCALYVRTVSLLGTLPISEIRTSALPLLA